MLVNAGVRAILGRLLFLVVCLFGLLFAAFVILLLSFNVQRLLCFDVYSEASS